MKKNGNKFGSKADTLIFLEKKITKGKIEKILSITVKEWKIQKEIIIKKILREFYPSEIIVRSSAKGEDSIKSTEAGKYKSIQKVRTEIQKNIENAVDEVIKTYSEKNNENNENQVLIQKQTTGVITNGVVFTRTPENGSPYYVINYSDSKETDNVTKGETSNLVKIFHGCNVDHIPKKWKKLILAIKEIENIFKTGFLDIEFGITKKNVVIFQVRPLTSVKEPKIEKLENKIKKQIKKNQKKYQMFSFEKKKEKEICYFSDMADWNPAEIIGNNPNPLDYSLYDFLFMTDTWQKGRKNIGYEKNLSSNLMEKFGNKPYINIKKSFYSLFPEKVDKKIKEKLMKFYLKKLKENPHLHDKVEFYILFSCYDFSFNDRKKELVEFGFTKKEIKKLKESLIEFTNKIIINFSEIKERCMKDTKIMEQNRKIIKSAIKKNIKPDFEAAEELLLDCKKFGAQNFTSMARIAFIGNILLKSLVAKNVINDEFTEEVIKDISSPLSEIQSDLELFSKKKITKHKFLQKYGHLRPGTYDISANRYDENHDFLKNIKFLTKPEKKSGSFSRNYKINQVLKNDKIVCNDKELIEFIKESTQLREVLKFEFTKNLSDALSLIKSGGKDFGLSTNNLSYLEIQDIFNFKKFNKKTIQKIWNQKISQNKKIKEINEFMVLPPLIFSEKDFEIINYNLSKPNFITTKKITANIEKLPPNQNKNINFSNRIIFTENADPGYDWIFTKNPAGLITKYGGVASHMAIRCAELGLPAAIGIGEIIFQKIENAKTVLLDCENQQVIVLENINNDEHIEEKKILKSLGYIR